MGSLTDYLVIGMPSDLAPGCSTFSYAAFFNGQPGLS
jgi:hypothetical protein